MYFLGILKSLYVFEIEEDFFGIVTFSGKF